MSLTFATGVCHIISFANRDAGGTRAEKTRCDPGATADSGVSPVALATFTLALCATSKSTTSPSCNAETKNDSKIRKCYNCIAITSCNGNAICNKNKRSFLLKC